MSSLPASTASPSISCSSSELACLTASIPSIWASSASRSGAHVDRGAAGNVVEHDRCVAGGAGHLPEVGEDAAAVRLVVVGRDGQDRVHAGLDGLLGQVDRVAGVVGARAADHDALVPELADDQRDQPEVLLVGHRRRFARRPGHDQPVGAVREQVAANGDRILFVDGTVGTERCDHGRK